MSKQQQDNPETLRLFTWDGARLIQEETTQHKYTYIYRNQGSFEPLAQVVEELETKESHVLYYHANQVGIPKEVTDAEGNLAWYGHYKAWGQLQEEHNLLNIHQPFRLQNQYFDAETGLHYNLWRYYDSHYGRFINQDPIGLFGGDNLYQFAPNAMGWIDPFGLEVSAVYNLKTGKLVVIDQSVNFGSGATFEGSFKSGGDSETAPIPIGEYDILEQGDKPGIFYRLEPIDSNYGDDTHKGTGRKYFRLHHKGLFGVSYGCISSLDDDEWKELSKILEKTKISTVEVLSKSRKPLSPKYETLKKYGTLKVISGENPKKPSKPLKK